LTLIPLKVEWAVFVLPATTGLLSSLPLGKYRMSHTLYTATVQRVQRCELAVPGSNPELFEKALKSGVDFVFLDLEDAVAPDDKLQARKNIIQAINDLDWQSHGITVSVRINGLDTQYMVRDVVDLVEQAGSKIDTILIPKVGVYSDVYMVEAMLNQLEMQQGLKNRIGIEALIETALGMANVEDIAKQGALGGRLEALHFGVADYAASNRARTTNIGGLNPDYPGDQWHFAISRMTVACRAYGLRPIDGPFGDFKDPEGYKLGAKRAAALGCEGKWAIHPSQVALANEVFTPPAAEIEKAKRILVALQEAAAQGKGAAALDGRLIDAASEKMANNVVRAAEAIAAKTR
jgi:citrate lyase subunit beta/citryl-CoA lyase